MRTFAIGDVHGDFEHLQRLMAKLPRMDALDTIVFLGDYVDRGPQSRQVVEYVRDVLPNETMASVVCLRGNHEDAWMRATTTGFPEFILPPTNGALACMRSYTGGPIPAEEELPQPHEVDALFGGQFFPLEHLEWFQNLPFFYEDEHAIYVHAGLPPDKATGGFMHPSVVPDTQYLLWMRTRAFFTDYRGKTVVVGHTSTDWLPQELSSHTPEDPTDLWAGEAVFAIDTGCGKGGFLTALELPSKTVYESR